MGLSLKGQIREVSKIWRMVTEQEVSHSTFDVNLTNFYSSIKINIRELGATHAIGDSHGETQA